MKKKTNETTNETETTKNDAVALARGGGSPLLHALTMEGRGLNFYLFRGRIVVIAAEAGAVMGYADDGKKMVMLVRAPGAAAPGQRYRRGALTRRTGGWMGVLRPRKGKAPTPRRKRLGAWSPEVTTMKTTTKSREHNDGAAARGVVKVDARVAYDFHGDRLEVVEHDGEHFVVLARLCEPLELQVHGQAAKLKRLPWAGGQIICAPTAGGMQESFCIPIRSVAGWLFSVNLAILKEAARLHCAAAGDHSERTFLREFKDRENQIRLHVHFPASLAQRWESLPLEKFGEAQSKALEIREREKRRMKSVLRELRARVEQLELPLH